MPLHVALPAHPAIRIALLAVLTACSNGGPSRPPAGQSDSGTVDVQPFFGSDAIADTWTTVDSAPPTDTSEADANPAYCPYAVGCPCLSASDCNTALCLETPHGRQCAATCIDACPNGHRCAAVPHGSDVLQACVSAWARLCSPCAASADCNHPGVTDARCIDRGDAGTTCGVGCAGDDDCPDDYACKNAIDVEGNTTSQCVPVGPGGKLASCSCSTNAAALALVGSCKQVLVTPQGELSCSGGLQCKKTGEAPTCNAAVPAPEACNGVDDDCSGKTDDGACDDGEPCTTDACDVSKAACTHQPFAQGSACDADGDPCTVGDSCQSGACVAGAKKSCDDGNPCTIGACDLAGGCTQTDADGAACSDDNPCTLADQCSGGSCSPGAPKPCPTADACTLANCTPSDGKCKFAEVDDGVVCDDGNPCTEADACKLGLCKGKGVVCDDGNLCTSESCTLGDGCVSKALDAGACDDGDACTSGDACVVGLCKGATATACDDGNGCTADACDKANGCSHVAKTGASCDDGDACTAGDVCLAGACAAGKEVNCDDGNACTVDACHKDSGCSASVQVGLTQTCYAGPAGTAGVGACAAGKQTCDAKGQLGPCEGAVLPALAEGCDGKDDDCDGQIDEGCKAAAVALSAAPLRVRALGQNAGLDAALQTGPSGATVGGKNALRWSLVELWRGWFGGN